MTALFLSDLTDDPPAQEEAPAEFDQTDYLFEPSPDPSDTGTDEELAGVQDKAIIADMVRSFYNCPGCAAPLPAWRGSWCDACVERGE